MRPPRVWCDTTAGVDSQLSRCAVAAAESTPIWGRRWGAGPDCAAVLSLPLRPRPNGRHCGMSATRSGRQPRRAQWKEPAAQRHQRHLWCWQWRVWGWRPAGRADRPTRNPMAVPGNRRPRAPAPVARSRRQCPTDRPAAARARCLVRPNLAAGNRHRFCGEMVAGRRAARTLEA